MSRKILIPLDGSETAEPVLPYARALARSLSCPVELLAVVDFTELARSASSADGLFIDRLLEGEAQRSGHYLDGIARSFAGVSVRCAVEKGRAAEIIVDKAAADKDTLIMMATHGRSGLNRFVLGSVTERVLRTALNPLIVVRAKEGAATSGEAAFQSLMVPLDGSELAESVLPAVVEIAKLLDLEITLLRAFAIPYGAYSTGDGFYDPVNLEAFLASRRLESVEYIDQKSAALKRQGIARVSSLVKEGLAADEIIAFGKTHPGCLIAMGTHGYSGIKRWVLGSVTETVVRHADAPVLVLRAGS
jgi:nucleotide-binding universal stress UspA family protein